jgi:hypothetical protein
VTERQKLLITERISKKIPKKNKGLKYESPTLGQVQQQLKGHSKNVIHPFRIVESVLLMKIKYLSH